MNAEDQLWNLQDRTDGRLSEQRGLRFVHVGLRVEIRFFLHDKLRASPLVDK